MNEDKSTRYQRLRRHAAVASVVWSFGVLVLLVWTGAAVALRLFLESAIGPARSVGVIAAYVAVLVLVHEIGAFALGVYGGFGLERRYGLSTQTLRQWTLDQLKALVLTYLLAVSAAVVVHGIIRMAPAWWWLLAWAAFTLLLALMATVAPVVLMPLFYSIKPLARADLRARLLALADRAGARVLGAYEWGLGAKSRKANAALTGLGGTRRILVSDTMLAAYSDDEIEVVLAHELAHHVYGDLWKGLLFDSGLLLVGLGAAALVLRVLGPATGLRDVTDVAGLPLLVLAAGAVSLVMTPIANAVSRSHETRADRFALELTRNPTAFISAMRRLGQQNLAEDQPSRLVQWLFHSHPPMSDRIAAALAYRP